MKRAGSKKRRRLSVRIEAKRESFDVFRHIREYEPRCGICLEDYEEHDYLIQLRCAHVFHERCGWTWWRAHETCPKCRG